MKKIAISIISLTIFITAQNVHPFMHGKMDNQKLHNSSNSEIPKFLKKILRDNGGTIEVLATIPSGEYSGPVGMVLTSYGALIVTDYQNNKLWSISKNGTVSLYAGSGTSGIVEGYGELAQFHSPVGLAINNDTIYVANQVGNAISKIYPDKYVQVFAGDPESGYVDATGLDARFSRPTFLAMDTEGNLFVTDQTNNRIRKITPTGAVSTFLGNGANAIANGTGLSASIELPFGIEIDNKNNLYVSHTSVNRPGLIQKISPDSVMTTYYDLGTGIFGDMSIDSKGNLYAPEFSVYHNIYKISPDSSIIKIAGNDANDSERGGEPFNTSFSSPYSVLVHPLDDRILYVSDYGNGQIHKLILNNPPLLAAIADVTINEDESTAISLSASDSDGDSISFTLAADERNALIFDGDDDYVSIGHPSDGSLDFDNNIFSYSVWFKTTNPEFQQIICKRGGGGNFEMQISKTLSANYASSSDTLNDGIWHNAVWTSNGDTVKLYVDGYLNSTEYINPSDGFSASGSGPLNFGADSYQGEYFKGSIDEVAIWGTTLSYEKVLDLYNSGSGSQASLIESDYLAGYWKIEGFGESIIDFSSNNNNGIIDGAKWMISGSKFMTSTISGSSLTLLPAPNWNGESIITVIADDKYSYDTTSFTLIVTPVQDPPSAFEWISSSLETIAIDSTNLDSTYSLQWSASTDVDGDSINYLIYAKIGLYPTEEVEEITDTAFQLVYEEILEQVFEGSPVNGATVKLNVKATDGIDTVDVTGDNRVIYVNRYDYLSVLNEGIPTEFALHENYPNPFNPSTTLRFDLPYSGDVNLTIYNMLGQKVKSFDMRGIQAGKHILSWNATNDFGEKVGSGVYMYQLQTKDFMKTRKMIYMK